MQRIWIALAGLAGCGAVGMAAFAAHGLHDPNALRIVESGVRMQGWHAWHCWEPRFGRRAAAGLRMPPRAAFAVGMLLFCGSVYSLGLAGVSLGLLAPTGGITLMLGWLLLAASALRAR